VIVASPARKPPDLVAQAGQASPEPKRLSADSLQKYLIQPLFPFSKMTDGKMAVKKIPPIT
jgi:hypothetical protein